MDDDDLIRRVFPTEDPPPGGLTRLRAHLDAAERPRRAWVPAVAGLLAATAAVALLLLPRAPEVTAPTWTAADHPALANLGYAAPATPGATPGQRTLRRPVDTGDDDVLLYWVSGAP